MATDADGRSLTYSVQSGSLLTGFTLNTSTGAITWSSVSVVGTDTTTTFTIRVTDGNTNVDRQFKITVKASVRTTYTSHTFSSIRSNINGCTCRWWWWRCRGGFGGGGARRINLWARIYSYTGGTVTVTIGNGGGKGGDSSQVKIQFLAH